MPVCSEILSFSKLIEDEFLGTKFVSPVRFHCSQIQNECKWSLSLLG